MYVCKFCSTQVGPGVSMLRYVTYRADRSVETESPVCPECYRFHGPGEPPGATPRGPIEPAYPELNRRGPRTK